MGASSAAASFSTRSFCNLYMKKPINQSINPGVYRTCYKKIDIDERSPPQALERSGGRHGVQAASPPSLELKPLQGSPWPPLPLGKEISGLRHASQAGDSRWLIWGGHLGRLLSVPCWPDSLLTAHLD